MPFAPSEIRGSDGIWLLELDVAGRIYRYATRAATVTDADGDDWEYARGLGALEVDLDDQGDPASISAVVTDSTDWATLAARGQELRLALATIRWWRSGTVLERALIVLRGRVAGVSYGTRSEPLTIEIVGAEERSAEPIPGPQHVVDTSTWPVIPLAIGPKIEGSPYPIVVGAPGHDPLSATPRAAVPVLACDFGNGLTNSRLLCCDRRIDAGTLRIFNLTLRTSDDATVSRVDDLLGREISYTDFAGTSGILGSSAGDDEYWAGFQDDSTYGLGILHRGAAIRGAGDVLRWLVEDHLTDDWDHARLEEHRAELNNYKIDTYINTPTDPWEWYSSEILRWLQVDVVRGGAGRYVRPLRYDATDQDAAAWLSVDRGDVRRAGPISYGDGPIYNELTLEYRPVRDTRKWYSRRILTARAGRLTRSPGSSTDERVYGSYLCARSQALYRDLRRDDHGVRSWSGGVRWCWDDATAGLILQGLAARYALPRRVLALVGGRELNALAQGAVVVLDDADRALTGAVALVRRRIYSVDEVRLELELLDHPVQSPVQTT